MNWFAQYRQDWIREMLSIYGFINRAHLIRKFNISTPQASKDLTTFRATFPGAMTYDNRRKSYLAADRLENDTGLRVGTAGDHESE